MWANDLQLRDFTHQLLLKSCFVLESSPDGLEAKIDVDGAQEAAKNLITESIRSYESAGDVKKVAAARVELAYCYWREGALNEARIMLNEALQKLTTEGNTRASALLSLAIVEWSAARI